MSNKWYPFSWDQVKIMCANPSSPEDKKERICPICKKNSVRFYYHETHGERTIGTSWVWCHNCNRYHHFSGVARSEYYYFDDPFLNKNVDCSFDDLNLLWDKGILPQTFKKKQSKL